MLKLWPIMINSWHKARPRSSVARGMCICTFALRGWDRTLQRNSWGILQDVLGDKQIQHVRCDPWVSHGIRNSNLLYDYNEQFSFVSSLGMFEDRIFLHLLPHLPVAGNPDLLRDCFTYMQSSMIPFQTWHPSHGTTCRNALHIQQPLIHSLGAPWLLYLIGLIIWSFSMHPEIILLFWGPGLHVENARGESQGLDTSKLTQSWEWQQKCRQLSGVIRSYQHISSGNEEAIVLMLWETERHFSQGTLDCQVP